MPGRPVPDDVKKNRERVKRMEREWPQRRDAATPLDIKLNANYRKARKTEGAQTTLAA